MTLVQFTVGKVDAGMAILLTEDHHLIEFPSLLLPTGVSAGSIVNISVCRNKTEEERKMQQFWDLENNILEKYGQATPQAPFIRVKNLTQTSLILEWDPLVLHLATLRSLEIFKNGSRVAQQTSDDPHFYKLSGLDVDHDYEFHLVAKTTAGLYKSNLITTRTHKMDNLTGIRVAFGNFEHPELVMTEMKQILERVDATWTDGLDHKTTHLLAELPGGRNYETAVRHSIPVVKPDWLVQCEKNKKIQPALPYYIVGMPSG